MPRVLSTSEIAGFRERLCEAAERLFAEHGPDGVSMRRLAAELGCSAMTPYRYFRDKDEILAAVRAGGLNRFAEALEDAYAAPGDPLARAVAVVDAYARFAFENPAAYRLIFDIHQPNEAAYPALVRAGERARRTMSAYLRGLVDAGLVEGDPDLLGYVFWATLHGVVVLQLAGKLPSAFNAERVRTAAFGALVRGFAPSPRRPQR